MGNCLICDSVVEEGFASLFVFSDKVCYICQNSFEVRNECFFIEGVKGCVLYYYDSFFKNLLYKYKGCGDYALKDTFLRTHSKELRRKYKGYSLILAPSNKEREEKRGFNHLEEMFKCLNLPIIKCFKKTKAWKQSDKKLKERENVQKVIKLDKSCLNNVKRVLIVDDVLTSGSTVRALIRQLPSCIDKKVLVLSSNCRIVRNEIV